MPTLIENVHLVPDGKHAFKGSLLCENGKIIQLSPEKILLSNEKSVQRIDGHGAWLLPGLIDLHLHGSYGADFIRQPQVSINTVAAGLIQEGTTSFLASLTVVSHPELCDLLHQYSFCRSPEKTAHFLGVHSEGPYLSKEYKALMDERWLRDPCESEFREMMEAANGCLKMMTVAPERKGMKQLIPALKQAKVTVMLGHTACTCKEALDALSQGAQGFTHLYNAMSQHSHRDPGAVTAAFLHPDAMAELIVDGFHSHPDIVRATMKILGPRRLILITDAMLGKGMPDGDYCFSNLNCRKRGNTVQVIETGRIAGSAITQLDALRNLRQFTGCSFNDLVQMACVNPAKLIHADQKGSLAPGKDADMILVDAELRLLMTFIDGIPVYSSSFPA